MKTKIKFLVVVIVLVLMCSCHRAVLKRSEYQIIDTLKIDYFLYDINKVSVIIKYGHYYHYGEIDAETNNLFYLNPRNLKIDSLYTKY